jgi:lysylphosphatidylglycerol synthetase-like protein (DUF2156 family)
MGTAGNGRITVDGLRVAKKAIVGGVSGLIGSLVTALSDGAISPVEVGVAVLTGLAASLAVYQTTNDAPLE